MQNGRLNAEEAARQLTDENNDKAKRIEALIADFETMKNEMMESNAIKDQYIDSLNTEVFGLNEKNNYQILSKIRIIQFVGLNHVLMVFKKSWRKVLQRLTRKILI